MFSIVYVSTATKLYEEEDLEQILLESRNWNRKVDLTGLLLYKDGNFMQFLEGPKKDVLEILAKIRSDRRHHSMIIILQQENREREFDSWSMGFVRLHAKDHPAPEGFTDLWERPFSSEEFLTNPTRTVGFLLGFKQTVH
jgi:hypothetical protein